MIASYNSLSGSAVPISGKWDGGFQSLECFADKSLVLPGLRLQRAGKSFIRRREPGRRGGDVFFVATSFAPLWPGVG